MQPATNTQAGLTPETHEEDPLYQRQLAMEAEMVGAGVDFFRKSIENARAGGRESTTKHGMEVIGHLVDPLTTRIREKLAEAASGKAGRRHNAIVYLREVDIDVAAYIALKSVIDCICKRMSFSRTAVIIGMCIEDEAKFRHFYREEKYLMDAIMERLTKESRGYKTSRAALSRAMTKHSVDWCGWGDKARFHVGSYLLDAIITSTGLCYIHTQPNGHNKSQDLVELAPEWAQRIAAWIKRSEALYPRYMPTIIPPVEWTSPYGGGYYSPQNQIRLVKTPKREFHEELANIDMPLVYQAVNALQATPWSINEPVYAVMDAVWENGLDIGITPPRNDLEKPPIPPDMHTNPEAKTAWKRAARIIVQGNLKARSKRIQFSRVLQIALRLKKEAEFYFPYQLDFRGRIYAVPMFLNPQGPDNAKGLLRFAEGKPLGTTEAAGWLAVHGANLYGEDKVSLKKRIEWVEENTQRIVRCAEDPISDLWWTEADKPWQFLAFCFEWAGYQAEGLEFVSYLPIALDGSCNGLQHFSAMLRDEVGGRAVNLVPNEKPQDIYQAVADRVVAKLEKSKEDNYQNGYWLDIGIDRSVTKRPVMVVPYGGTRMSCRDYVDEAIHKKFKEGSQNPFGKEYDKALNYLTGLVWEAIGEVVVSARLAMGWLQAAAREISKVGLPTVWTAPSGFPVRQAYLKVDLFEIKTVIAGSIRKPKLARECTEIDPMKQSLGVSPNFVHSIDASHLVFCMDAAIRAGVGDFAMVHDSYGTHACNTPVLAKVLRESFVKLYEMDVLKAFADEVSKVLPDGKQLPPLPPRGTLDLNQVLDSDFFFA